MDRKEIESQLEEKIQEKEIKVSKWVSLVVSIFPFIMYYFPLQIMLNPIWSEAGSERIINGYDSVLQRVMIPLWWGDELEIIATINTVVLFIAIALLITNVFNLIIDKFSKIIYNISSIIIGISTLIYFVEGVLLVVLFDPSFQPTTFAYFSLIFLFLIISAKVFIKKYDLD